MNRYVEASPKARRIVFAVILAWAGLVVVLARFEAWFPVNGTLTEQLVQRSDRAFFAAVIATAFYVGLSVLVVIGARLTARARQWPPPGLPMPFRTQVRTIERPARIWVLAGLLAAMYGAQALAHMWSWWQAHLLVHKLMPLLDSPNPAALPRLRWHNAVTARVPDAGRVTDD